MGREPARLQRRHDRATSLIAERRRGARKTGFAASRAKKVAKRRRASPRALRTSLSRAFASPTAQT